jgi:uncharacterized damage-inducible protein DinB
MRRGAIRSEESLMKKSMRKFTICILAFALMSLVGASRALAQGTSAFDFKAASLADIKDTESKFVGLAKAIPQEKYTWRPGDGVRSISEVFLHIASANYGLPPMMGATPPEGFNRQGFEKSTTDKNQVVDQLTKSFAYLESSVEKTSQADLEKKVKMFGGKEGTGGDVLFLVITDLHEHLGQIIAYARQNSIVPPWTAARQRPSSGQ